MHTESAEYRKIECTQCGWETLLDLNGIFDWLVKYRVFKPTHKIDDELVYELFHSLTDRYVCPDCGGKRLKISVVTDDFSDQDERRCLGCRKVIPRERLECVPDAKYCVSCQEKLENGEPLPLNVEYCPICGRRMDLVEVRDGRHVDFKLVCPSNPPCRYRKK